VNKVVKLYNFSESVRQCSPKTVAVDGSEVTIFMAV